VGDEFSEGCNNLIRDNGAALLTDAEHFVKAMGWEGDASLAKARSEGIERTIFPNLSPEEATVVETLAQRGDLHLNMLATQTGIAVNRLTSVLFELEMKGLLRNMAGGMYHLMPMR
jgi:DNA processing protein